MTTPERERLFAAFVAGFDAAGEGWNGEYTGRASPTVMDNWLHQEFDSWVDKVGGDDEGRADR